MRSSPLPQLTAPPSAPSPRRPRRPVAYGAVAVLVAAVAFVAGPQASARSTGPAPSPAAPAGSPPAGFTSWGELAAAQLPLSEAAGAIEGALGDSPAFTSLTVSVEDRSVTLYHKGGEEQVEAAVAPQRAKGVRVELRSAPYNRSELREAAASLMGRSLTIDGQLTSVHSAGARSDGSGLLVEGEPLRANDTNSGNGQARTAGPTVPWTGTVTGAPAPLESREQDAPLHSGGMLLRQRYKGGPICTSGFVVTWPQRGLDYLMTAAHCSEAGKTWYAGDQDIKLGPVSDRSERYDTELIPTHGGFLHNYTIWSGQPVYRQSQQLLNVNRAAHSYVGEYLCVSGSLSGEVCNLKVAEGKHFTRYKEFSTGTEVYTLKNTGGGFTAMKGDSGGPVFSRNLDGSVVARGLISAGVIGAKTETCSNPAANNSPVECYRHIYVTDVPDVLNQHPGMRIAN
ncbi:S1 family peptidase [Streptomyces goshikiensis]|uniref:S1 family peptidase n=1 Tax=Streptomyces goshikiensis TaxID=1942 RepID=A0ABZ1RVB2_9ACTN|nr:hypothetical protein [Streptomyces goshikiensis]